MTPPRPVGFAAGYDLWSESYDAHDNPMLAMVDHVLAVSPLAAAGLRVVELGCGTGRNLARVAAAGAAAYTGLDGSAGMLAVARRRPAATLEPRWLEADLQAPLPLPDAAADLILVTLVLEHLGSLDALFLEARRVLAPGGALRILELHPELAARGAQAHFWHEGEELRLPSHRHDAAAYRTALASAGLSPACICDWWPSPDLAAQRPKLARHQGAPLMIEVAAVNSACSTPR